MSGKIGADWLIVPFFIGSPVSRLVSLFAIALLPAFMSLSVLAPVLGRTQPGQSLLDGFSAGCTDQPQPCWYGVVPGVTTEPEVLQHITFAGQGRTVYDDSNNSHNLYFTLPKSMPACFFVFRIQRGIVIRVEIWICGRTNLRFGDMLLVQQHHAQPISLVSQFVVRGSLVLPIDGWPSPSSTIKFFNMLASSAVLERYPWHGFMPMWRYCQLEAEYPRCPD